MRLSIILALVCAAEVADAQNNVAAIGREFGFGDGFWERGPLHLQLGRELRPRTRRLGVRLSLEYARDDRRVLARPLVFTDSGFATGEPVIASSRERVLGAWVTTTYVPMRWIVEPYLIAGLGIQDSYWHYMASAPDSVFRYDNASTAQTGGVASSRKWLGPAASLGLGVSSRIGRVTLFGELRQRNELTFGRAYGNWDRPLTIGVRF